MSFHLRQCHWTAHLLTQREQNQYCSPGLPTTDACSTTSDRAHNLSIIWACITQGPQFGLFFAEKLRLRSEVRNTHTCTNLHWSFVLSFSIYASGLRATCPKPNFSHTACRHGTDLKFLVLSFMHSHAISLSGTLSLL